MDEIKSELTHYIEYIKKNFLNTIKLITALRISKEQCLSLPGKQIKRAPAFKVVARLDCS